MHCRTASEQWAVELVQCTPTLLISIHQWNPCKALPLCLGAVRSGSHAMNCLTALGAVGNGTRGMHYHTVELLQCTGSLPRGSG